MRGSEETPSGSQAGPLNTSRKSSSRTAAGRENRKTYGCGALPTPQLVKIGQVTELLKKKGRVIDPGRGDVSITFTSRRSEAETTGRGEMPAGSLHRPMVSV